MATFETRVRDLIQEELRDVYRLFQDAAEQTPQVAITQEGLTPMLLDQLRELKEEVRHIENMLTDQPATEEDEETDPKDKDPEKKRRAIKRLRKVLEWLLDNLDPSDDVKEDLMKLLPVGKTIVDVPIDLLKTLFTTVVGATNHSRTRNELWTCCNKLQSELQIIAAKVARIKPQTYEDLSNLLQQQTQIITEQITGSSAEIGNAILDSEKRVIDSVAGIDRNITVIGRDLTFEIESLYSRMIAGGGLFAQTFR